MIRKMVSSVLFNFLAKYRPRCLSKVPRLLTVASITFGFPSVVEAHDDGLKDQKDVLMPPRSARSAMTEVAVQRSFQSSPCIIRRRI